LGKFGSRAEAAILDSPSSMNDHPDLVATPSSRARGKSKTSPIRPACRFRATPSSRGRRMPCLVERTETAARPRSFRTLGG
jgi:hypothetical protein